jgi:hypothetical protein
MWAAIKEFIPVRNLSIHGIWAILDSVPLSLSYRFSSGTGSVLGEPFDLERLQAVERQCFSIKQVLDGLSGRLIRENGLAREGRAQQS